SLTGRFPGADRAARAAAEHLFAESYVQVDSARARRELDAPTPAVRNARSAPGSFPIIVYGPSRGGEAYENSTLMEYLAGWGYIVVASPSWGAAGPMPGDFAGIETQARDMEFLRS